MVFMYNVFWERKKKQRGRESEVCHISILINIARNKNLNNQILSKTK
jgi:hypothetical protein